MKPTLNEEIGISQQGIDYVNSLEVKDVDVIRAAIDQIKNNSEYKPNFIKYFDGEKWVEVYYEELEMSETHEKYTRVTLNYDTAMKAIKNNIPEEIEKQRIRKQARNAWICVFVIIAITVILNWK